MKKDIVKTITSNAIVAAIYFLLTLINPLSFGMIQIRISEMLVLLCFFNKDYVFGVTIGCLFANLLPGSYGFIDVIFGTLTTLLSCLGVSLFKHLALSTLIPVVLNGFVIGAEIYLLTDATIPAYGIIGFVALGEFLAVSIFGYLLFLVLKKSPKFFEVIRANQNQEFRW